MSSQTWLSPPVTRLSCPSRNPIDPQAGLRRLVRRLIRRERLLVDSLDSLYPIESREGTPRLAVHVMQKDA